MARGHRESLLAAARTLLRRKGLQATTARDLVEESGTNLASIGYHFGGKDALMSAALTEVLREWTDRPVAAGHQARDGGPGESLAAAIRTMLASLDQRRPEILAATEAIVASGHGEPIGAGLPTELRTMIGDVATGMRRSAPGLTPEAAAAVAVVVIALHDGLALLSTVVPEAVPEPETVLRALAGIGALLQPVLEIDPHDVRTTIEGTERMPE